MYLQVCHVPTIMAEATSDEDGRCYTAPSGCQSHRHSRLRSIHGPNIEASSVHHYQFDLSNNYSLRIALLPLFGAIRA